MATVDVTRLAVLIDADHASAGVLKELLEEVAKYGTGVPAKSFVASYHGPVLDKVYHVQTANNYHEQLKTWIQRGLRGVATKNLPRYLAWKRLLSWGKGGASASDVLTSALGRQTINL